MRNTRSGTAAAILAAGLVVTGASAANAESRISGAGQLAEHIELAVALERAIGPVSLLCSQPQGAGES